MQIYTLTFFTLLSLSVLAYYIVPQKNRWIVLLCASTVFYSFCGIIPLLFLFATTLITYIFGRLIEQRQQKIFVVLPLITVFLILAILKYSKFCVSLFSENISVNFLSNIIVPLGISFYTFSSAAYLIDVYKGKIKAERNLAKFALYITFFPQITQGPIPRYDRLSHQLYEGHEFNYEKTVHGILLILWGLFKKLVLAERCALAVSAVYDAKLYSTTFYVLLATFMYAVQLYADFSGYMNIAIGCAKLYGINLDENFNTPYFSVNISDFWRRWHITLSDWLRDYIYIPLGGNRKGNVRKIINILIVFLVSGIWHGSAWTFIVWGIYHGVLSAINTYTLKAGKNIRNKLKITDDNIFVRVYQYITTFALVCFGWIFFRANSLSDAFFLIKGIFRPDFTNIISNARVFFRQSGYSEPEGIVLLFAFIIFVAVEILNHKKIFISEKLSKSNSAFQIIAVSFSLLILLLFAKTGGTFMYVSF